MELKLNQKSQYLLNLLLTIPPDFAAAKELLKRDDFSPEEVTRVAICYAEEWDEHIQTIEARKKTQRQAILRKQFASVCNYRMAGRYSLLFRYFQVAVPKGSPETFPCRVIKRDICNSYDLLLCRLPRRKAKDTPSIAESIKAYCIENERLDYEQFCTQAFPQTKEAI